MLLLPRTSVIVELDVRKEVGCVKRGRHTNYIERRWRVLEREAFPTPFCCESHLDTMHSITGSIGINIAIVAELPGHRGQPNILHQYLVVESSMSHPKVQSPFAFCNTYLLNLLVTISARSHDNGLFGMVNMVKAGVLTAKAVSVGRVRIPILMIHLANQGDRPSSVVFGHVKVLILATYMWEDETDALGTLTNVVFDHDFVSGIIASVHVNASDWIVNGASTRQAPLLGTNEKAASDGNSFHVVY